MLSFFLQYNELEPIKQRVLLEEIQWGLNSPYKYYFLFLLNHEKDASAAHFWNSQSTAMKEIFEEEITMNLTSTMVTTPEEADAKLMLALTSIDVIIEEWESMTVKIKERALQRREILKSDFIDLSKHISDQNRGISLKINPAPPSGLKTIKLPEPNTAKIIEPSIAECIKKRKSHRSYSTAAIPLSTLSFLLWATQGVHRISPNQVNSIRTVPSGGARHPFETWIVIQRVEGAEPGIWKYSPFTHEIVLTKRYPDLNDLGEKLFNASLEQLWVRTAAITFFWTCIPYRCEWRYSSGASKLILQESGHICQNLYLACEATGCGTVAISAYHQELSDSLLGVDGHEELTVYIAPVGVRK
ncbi:MAG: SagB/ThcOx family dehydrogenase [Oligoflexia bacterium]|nr:SagB/ThcOx family dehydrogenase [Oligoflexia bacterium]MBF0367085.1 SagB/ThcOx family dehydrogenase [Oligoflexia bacterium]